MFIEKMSYIPGMVDGLRQMVMIYSVLLDSARKETKSEVEAYKMADHVFVGILSSSENSKNK
ncbi:hypothetical protein C5O77_10220 [Limosilactobacillus reuteri]|uniref:Uncharacterized protein n=1 Tax=Limosilactobacillus reuteri TaxID=1598 RepID=A0A3M6SAV9_LIMRT|nr:hypothetical protein [Limosilactobacillus reuteri]RMX24421.1 hypothetical protein C5O77_10220 [Limosilactobacillus reuteri]